MKKKICLVAGLSIVLVMLFTACNKSEDNTTGKTKFAIPVSDEIIRPNSVFSFVEKENKLKSAPITNDTIVIQTVIKDTTVMFRGVKKLAVKISSNCSDFGTMIWMLPKSVPNDLLKKGSGSIANTFYYSYDEAKGFTEAGWRIPTVLETNVLHTLLKLNGRTFPDIFDIDNTDSFGLWNISTNLAYNSDEYYYWTNDISADIYTPSNYKFTIHTPYDDDGIGYDLENFDYRLYKSRIMLVKKL